MLHAPQMSPPRLMKKVWAAVENRGSPDPVTVTLQEQSNPPNPSQSEAEGDNTGVRGSSFMGEEITPRSDASSDNGLRQTSIMGDHGIDNRSRQTSIMGGDHGIDNRSRQTSIMGGDHGIDNRSRQTSIMGGESGIDDAAREQHGEKKEEEEEEEEGAEQQQQQQQQQHQQQLINGNLLDNSLSRRWLATKKYCKIALCILLAVAVVACYRYKSSFTSPPWNAVSPTPPRSLSKQRRELNLQLVLKQILNPSNRQQIIYSLSISGKQHLPDDFLPVVAAFTAFCHPDTFIFAIFLSQNLSDAFENQRPPLSSQQVRAVLLQAYELADRAAGAEAKADPAARRKLVGQDAIEVPPVDIAFENQTLYHHLISSPTSSPHSSKKKEEEEEEALYHQCEALADSDYAGTYLVQVMYILKELYMIAAADGPLEERWAREVRDGFDMWFYERLLRISSFYGRR